jgi:hypothetical protein
MTKTGGCVELTTAESLILATCVVLVGILLYVCATRNAASRQRATIGYPVASPGALGERLEPHPDDVAPDGQRRTLFRELSKPYSTADVDPLVTGQLYAWRDDTRNVYGMRTSHGGKYGLHEFSSGVPGEVGVDQGPWGLDEYGGRMVGYDDGIPEAWRLPSTPVRWYRPRQRDYWGPQGLTPYVVGLYALREPDHEPLMN